MPRVARVRLTDAMLRKLTAPPAGKSEVTLWDSDVVGLGVRILASGTRRWIVRHGTPSGQQFQTLGDVGAIRLDEARELARSAVASVKSGTTPRQARAAAERRALDTGARLLDAYLLRRAKPRQRPRSYAETSRYLDTYAGSLRRLPVAEISRREVAHWLSEMAEAHGPVAANRARAALSGAFS
jgi:hypothetical protein